MREQRMWYKWWASYSTVPKLSKCAYRGCSSRPNQKRPWRVRPPLLPLHTGFRSIKANIRQKAAIYPDCVHTPPTVNQSPSPTMCFSRLEMYTFSSFLSKVRGFPPYHDNAGWSSYIRSSILDPHRQTDWTTHAKPVCTQYGSKYKHIAISSWVLPSGPETFMWNLGLLLASACHRPWTSS